MFSRFLLTLVLLGLVNSAAIGGDIRQAFSNVRVDREKLVIASRALGRRGVIHNFNYSLANDVIKGVKKVHLDAAADLVCSKLDLIDRDCDSVRNSFKLLAFAERGTAKLEEVSLDDGGFKSIYGYITGGRNSQGDVDIAYTVHQQEFTVEEMEFTVDEEEAMRHYLKHVALLNLKQENIIQSISYV